MSLSLRLPWSNPIVRPPTDCLANCLFTAFSNPRVESMLPDCLPMHFTAIISPQVAPHGLSIFEDEFTPLQIQETSTSWGNQPTNAGRLFKARRTLELTHSLHQAAHTFASNYVRPTPQELASQSVSQLRCSSSKTENANEAGT